MPDFKEFAEHTTVPTSLKCIWNDNYFPFKEVRQEIRSQKVKMQISKMRKRFLKRKKKQKRKLRKPEMVWDDRYESEYSLKKAMAEATVRRVKRFLFIDYYGNKYIYQKSYYRINQDLKQVYWKKTRAS